jgi:hypothetical protein
MFMIEWNSEKIRSSFERREMKKKYWMNKGCSERKADELIYRYGY